MAVEQKHIFLFSVVVTFLSLIMITTDMAIAQEGKEPELPGRIQKEIQLLRNPNLFPSNSRLDEAWRMEVVNTVYSWFRHELMSFSANDVINTYQQIFPTMLKKTRLTWKERLAFQYEPSDEPLVIHTIFWTSQQRELVVCQIDYTSYHISERAYLKSAPPYLYLKADERIVAIDLANAKDSTIKNYFNLNSFIYTIHGLIHPHDITVCPDILISIGPVGSGRFVYFVQMHYDDKAHAWKMVWDTDFSHVTNIEYEEDQGILTVTYVLGETPEEFSYQLQWGAYQR